MPIDSSIPLQVRPMQFPDPMESYGRALTLQSMVERGKMDAVRMKQLQTAEQLQEQKRKDMTVAEKAYRDANGDVTSPDFKKSYFGGGGSVPTFQSITAHDLEQTQKKTQLQKDQFDLGEKRNDRILNGLSQLLATPKEKRQALYSTLKGTYEADGTARKGQLPEQVPDDDWITNTQAAFRGESQQWKRAAELRAGEGEERAVAGEKREVELHPYKAEKAKGDAEQQQRGNAAGQLAAATTAAQYKSLWDRLPAGVARDFPAPEEWAADKTPATVRQRGMTPAEQETAARGARPVVQGTAQGTYLIDIGTGKSVEALTPAGQPIRRPKAGGEGTLAEERLDVQKEAAARKELAEIETAEYGGGYDVEGRSVMGLHETREGLGEILRTGKVTDAKGNEKDMQPNDRKNRLSHFQFLTKSLKQKIKRKFELGAITEEQRNQYLAEIDEGTLRVTGQPPKKSDTEKKAEAKPGEKKPASAQPLPTSRPAVSGRGAPAPTGQRIRVRLSNGQTGTVEASQFDPETMTKL